MARLLLAFLTAGALLCSRPAPAAEPALPTATEAAAEVGHDIDFQDVIKAISHSRTKPGCYFSFGAPFPEQALSVWVPDAVYYKLPYDPGLIGRTVRIHGRLEASPTGPMLTLASPQQFALGEVNEKILSKSALDGRRDREHFMAAVAQAFAREDFATLDELAADLLQSHERFSDGAWILPAYFGAFEVPSTDPPASYAAAEQHIAGWRTHSPTSAPAAIVEAGYHLDVAAHARQVGFKPPATRETYDREISRARELLEGNVALKAVPEYFVKMELVAYRQNWPRDAFFRIFDEAVAHEPDYYSFYFEAARYLLAAKPGDWERFAQEQRERHGKLGDVFYARIAWSMSVNYHNIFEQSAVSWEPMAAGFETMLIERPESRALKNAYARFAFQARDRTRLRPALAAVAEKPDMGVWVNLENVALAQRFAAEAPPAP